MDTENNAITVKTFVEAIAYLLHETFEGSPMASRVRISIAGLGFSRRSIRFSADAASAEFHGTTIAAQTEHAKFYLDRLCEFISGRTERVNWDDSWLIETVTDAEWAALRDSVRTHIRARCDVSPTFKT